MGAWAGIIMYYNLMYQGYIKKEQKQVSVKDF